MHYCPAGNEVIVHQIKLHMHYQIGSLTNKGVDIHLKREFYLIFIWRWKRSFSNQTSVVLLVQNHSFGIFVLLQQSGSDKSGLVTFDDSSMQLKLLLQKQLAVPRRTFSLLISSAVRPQEQRLSSLDEGREGKEWEPCLQNTAHCAGEQTGGIFSGTGSLTACALLLACDAHWSTTS